MQRCIALAVASLFVACATVFADSQVKSVRREPAKPASPKPPEHVEIKDTFVLATPFERWALDDPEPSADVQFGGKSLPLESRQITKSLTDDGADQYFFPVGWYEAYSSQPPSLKYVVVKYKNGKTCQVMAEYQPQSYVLPKADFEPHPDGKTFYSNIAVARQDGQIYLKQAISQGRDDGHDGLYVDMLVMYCVPDTTAPAKKP